MTEEFLLVKVPITDRKIPEGTIIEYGILADESEASIINSSLNTRTTMKRPPQAQSQTQKMSEDIMNRLTTIVDDFHTSENEYDKKIEEGLKTLEEWKKEFNKAKTIYVSAITAENKLNDLWITIGSLESGVDYENAREAKVKADDARAKFTTISKDAMNYFESEYIKIYADKRDALQEQANKIKQISKEIENNSVLHDSTKQIPNDELKQMNKIIDFANGAYERSKKEINNLDASKIINIHEPLTGGTTNMGGTANMGDDASIQNNETREHKRTRRSKKVSRKTQHKHNNANRRNTSTRRRKTSTRK